MQITVMDQATMQKYEDLVLLKDALLSEGDQYEISYNKEFGKELLDIFKLEVECVKHKKIITYIQAKLNRNEILDPEEMNTKILVEMQSYNHTIDQMINKIDLAKESKTISTFEANEVKRIYRNIAKKIHPDVSKIIEDHEDIRELWDKIYNCYRANDLKGIREANVILNKKMKDLDLIEYINVFIDENDLDKKIEQIEQEIFDIRNSIPYTYREILADKEDINKLHEKNKKQYEEYSKYLEELKTQIKILKEKR